jgi:hypothetical protein
LHHAQYAEETNLSSWTGVRPELYAAAASEYSSKTVELPIDHVSPTGLPGAPTTVIALIATRLVGSSQGRRRHAFFVPNDCGMMLRQLAERGCCQMHFREPGDGTFVTLMGV